MKANIRWIMFLLALVCVVQVASAFDVKTETVNPASGALEPGQPVNARYVLTYEMTTSEKDALNTMNDERLEFSTGLENPVWQFTLYRNGIPTPFPKRTERYPVLTEFDVSYGGDTKLDVQLSGTVPKSTTGKIEILKIQHMRKDDVLDTHSVTRDVVSKAQVEGSLSAQQNNLKALKAEIDDKAAQGVDVSAVQTKYNAASQALTSAASAGPSQASSYITTAAKNIDEAKSLLDKAWAEKEVSNAAATIESLDGMITYFVENRSMASDPQVLAIITKRESAVQYYSQAQDNLNAKNYPLARSKAADGLSKANEALTDANNLKERIGEGFNFGGNLLLYIGVGVILVLVVVGVVFYRKKSGWDELG